MEPANLQDAIRKLRGGNTAVRPQSAAPSPQAGPMGPAKPNYRIAIIGGLALAIVAIGVGYLFSGSGEKPYDRLDKETVKTRPAPPVKGAESSGDIKTGGIKIKVKEPPKTE